MEKFDQAPSQEKEKSPFRKKIENAVKMMSVITALSMPLAAEENKGNELAEPEADNITLQIKKANLPSAQAINESSDFMNKLMRDEAIEQGMEKTEVEEMMAVNAQEDSEMWVERVN